MDSHRELRRRPETARIGGLAAEENGERFNLLSSFVPSRQSAMDQEISRSHGPEQGWPQVWERHSAKSISLVMPSEVPDRIVDCLHARLINNVDQLSRWDEVKEHGFAIMDIINPVWSESLSVAPAQALPITTTPLPTHSKYDKLICEQHVDIGSKFPIINSIHHLLPSLGGELAPAIEAVLDIYGAEVVVIVSHNGQEETPLDRELQGNELGRIMIFLVAKPHAERPDMVDDGFVHDIDKDDMDRWYAV